MNKYLIPILILVALLLSSCILAPVQGSGNVIAETREVSDFEEVEVCCGMTLILTQGDETQLALEADDNIRRQAAFSAYPQISLKPGVVTGVSSRKGSRPALSTEQPVTPSRKMGNAASPIDLRLI